MSKKWVDTFIDVRGVSDIMIVIKVLDQGIIISLTSVYVPQCGSCQHCWKVRGEGNYSHSR